MKKNVLVFPCGSEIGLEIYKSLQYSTHFHLIGASSITDHGSYVYTDYIEKIPNVDSDDFITAINELITNRDIKYIFPAHDSVVLKLAQAKSEGKLACELITSSYETCKVTRSKKKTYDTFSDSMSVPRLYRIEELNDDMFPLFLKPEVGQGSKGTYKADNIDDVTFYTAKDPSLLIMEYLPGREYTVDCFTNRNGLLLFCEGRERSRISNGISVNSVRIKDQRFRQFAEKIQQKLNFKGVWFFQLKENYNGEFVLMEIAPRIAGTMGLERVKGVNLALLSLYDAEEMDVELVENTYDVVIDRALHNTYKHSIEYKHVYLDFDDTVIVDGKVNVQLMAFVFQCINNDVKVHLITRHEQNLDNTLAKFHLNNIFYEIIWIQDEREKHSYIEHKDVIFIDDSYAERKRMYDKLGIQVFDPHAVECLMENY